MANSTEKPFNNNDVRSLVSSHASMSLGDASWVKTVRADAMINKYKYHSCDRLGGNRVATETEKSVCKPELVESNVE